MVDEVFDLFVALDAMMSGFVATDPVCLWR